jgi:hypothetical protein
MQFAKQVSIGNLPFEDIGDQDRLRQLLWSAAAEPSA